MIVFGLHDPLLAIEIYDNLDHIDLKNLPPLGITHNVAVDNVQGIFVAWTLPSVANYLICNYDVHYIYNIHDLKC